MKLPLLFARRYLSSKKSLSVINIISRVSSFAVGIPVASMVILLSVFNGFEGLTADMYNSFDPDILITPTKGKVFATDDIDIDRLKAEGQVTEHSFMLEQSVLLEYNGNQIVATLRGVDSLYGSVIPIEKLIVSGKYELRYGEVEEAVVGQGIAYNLGIRTTMFTPLKIYTPRRGSVSTLLPMSVSKSDRVFPAGIYSLNADMDGTYTFSSLAFAQRLLDYPGRASGLLLKLASGADADKAAAKIKSTLGDDFKVETRYMQKRSMFEIMKYEKWGIFFITLLVLVIASFSIIGSIVMLIIDKKDNISTLITMGADLRLVRRIFDCEGMLIGVIGSVSGLVLGVALCLLQQHFGLIKIGAETFLVDAYPVTVKAGDVAGIMAAAIAVNYIITKFTVAKMLPKTIIRL